MTPDSHSAPTPTPPARSRTKPPRPWAASWRKSCEQKKRKNTGEKAKASSPVLFGSIGTFPRVGHGVGQAVDPHFDPHFFQHFYNKKALKTEVFDAFWSCWADSNCRPHPYQKAVAAFMAYPFIPRKDLNPMCCKGLEILLVLVRFSRYWGVLRGFRVSVGRVVGNQPASHRVNAEP